ncbi:MAG TPA: hypothetical protein VGJ85_03205 [Candidatus Nanopelagicaceae bacterium]
MFRKIITASVLGFVIAGSLVSLAPANAATKISNGVTCPKPNKTIKVSGTVYKCTKNPIVNKTKYTWVSSDCINSNTTYTKLNASYKSLVAGLPAALAALDAKIVAEQAKVTDSAAKADALDAQIVTWQAKVTEFTAAKAALLAKPNPSTYATAISTYTTAIRSLNSAIASNTAASAALRKIGKTVTTMQAQRAATVSSVTQAKAGVAQALSLRNLICQKGL